MASLIVLVITALLVLFLGFGKSRTLLPLAGATGLVISLFFVLSGTGQDSALFAGMLSFDHYARVMSASMMVITLLVFLLGIEYYRDMERNVAENYALMLFSLTGALLLTSFTNMVVLFLGIEILSIPLYILAGSKKKSYRSNEASFKYFLLGSFASAFLLFGITLLYGVTASFDLHQIREYLLLNPDVPMAVTGIMLIFIGMAFKVALVPFHFWSPDVYEGSPTLITAFMATVVKTAGFAAFWRLLDLALFPLPGNLILMLWIMTFLTLIVGNFSGLWQSSFKRLLAYSSIANSGFLILAVLSADPQTPVGLLYYTFTYSLGTLVAFSVFFSVKKASGASEQMDIFRGLWKDKPFLALALSLALMSLAGIPPLAGFFAKYLVFFQSIRQDFLWITLFAILMALVGMYYYFSVFRFIYSQKGERKSIPFPPVSALVLAFSLLLLVLLGIFPSLLLSL